MSKELEALEKIKNAPTIYVGLASDIYTRYPFECKEIEKALKALEIIKEKDVLISCLRNRPTLGDYNYLLDNPLTQEEYDLLKEVLL